MMAANDPKGELKDKDIRNFTIKGEDGNDYTAPKKEGYKEGDWVYYQLTGPGTAEILRHAPTP